MSGAASIFLAPLQKLLETFQRERHYKDERKDAALHSINRALIETKRYIEESEEVETVDRRQEYQLAQLWSEASVKARHASEDLAVRLQDKSAYWSDQVKWSREEVLTKRIDLDTIQQEVLDLLGGS